MEAMGYTSHCMQYISTRTGGAAVLGIITAVATNMVFDPFNRNHSDQTRSYLETEVHVHADFLVYLNGERLDLTGDQYQSKEGDTQHFYLHLHDNNGHVLHRHEEGYTFAQFFDSIGFAMTDECFITDTGEEYCTDEGNVLRLYVNGEVHPHPTSYIIQEEDNILLYYGEANEETIAEYLAEIPDDACISSGTCPERGMPQPETCSGATCEI